MSARSNSRLSALGARLVLASFAAYREDFREVTRRARRHFERRDWAEAREDASLRLGLYRGAVDRAEAQVRELLGGRCEDRFVWVGMKAVYSGLIDERQDWDIAETFFNSVGRRLFHTVGVDPLIEFVDTDFDAPPNDSPASCCRRYEAGDGLSAMLERLLVDRTHSVSWDDLERDARRLAERIVERAGGAPAAAEMLKPVFYRGKGAYLVGRLLPMDPQAPPLPFVVALRNGPRGLFVDAALLEEADLSMLFGFTRSYFQVDTPRPYELVRFLEGLLPKKPRGDLYISLGEPKQGKTELYRALRRHVEASGERFEAARGTAGLVMVVFTLPGHGVVIKVIRDRFPPEKQTSPERVRERYSWVYSHDRAGRLVDAQPFEHLRLPAAAFSAALLDELHDQCAASVRLEGEDVVLALAYVERKVTPLNLYLREVGPAAAAAAVVEMGQAIRDLAACNIFPGDLLPKNFGVTRHGRVAFYDYDELVELDACSFRALPEPETPEQELASEPWYPVAPGDVFPEEFPRFLGLNPALRRALFAAHAEIFTAGWWRALQERLAAGKILEFSPYPPERRLGR
jgi:isocitrate dehydrogenase kinase/phosphatase